MREKRGGRRPGDSGTREAILAAASQQFAQMGYDRASLRSIAAQAGVDPKLVAHFFGKKQQLFIAAVGLPINPAELLPKLLAGNRGTIAARITAVLTDILGRPEIHERMAGLMRAAASEPEVARMVREFLTRELFVPVARYLETDQPQLRLTLVGSQLVGLITARYIVGIEPLASAAPHVIAPVIAETFRRYLVDPLPDGASQE